MANTSKVRDIRNRMIEIFGQNCWMGYTVDRKNPFTFHHIFEQRKGGKDLMENGAVLTSHAHRDLNQLDMHKKDLYNELNQLFTFLNETKCPPTLDYYKEVNEILLVASRFIKLSPYCNLNPDFELVKEALAKRKIVEEVDDGYIKIDGIYMPVSYDTRDIGESYITQSLEKKSVSYNNLKQYIEEIPVEIVDIPMEYRGAVKKKNRNNKIYNYK